MLGLDCVIISKTRLVFYNHYVDCKVQLQKNNTLHNYESWEVFFFFFT